MPWRITFTGIDESCSLQELCSLLDADRRIELGILYSETQAGKGRYPSATWIRRTATHLYETHGHGRVALHLCGRAVYRLLRGDELDPELPPLWEFQRVQLNGRIDDRLVSGLSRLMGAHPGLQVITQFETNMLLPVLGLGAGHQVLFDSSGGRGLLRKDWPPPVHGRDCGYAGGLGPDNLTRELPRIAQAAHGCSFWIDMEGRLRDEQDRFSVRLAHRAQQAVVEVERLAA